MLQLHEPIEPSKVCRKLPLLEGSLRFTQLLHVVSRAVRLKERQVWKINVDS